MLRAMRGWRDVSLHDFAFGRWSREKSSELTNVGALKVVETLQQRDAATKQPVITFRCSRFFSDVARLLVKRLNLVPEFVSRFQSRSKFIGLRPKYRHRLARLSFSFPLGHNLLVLSCADGEFCRRTEDFAAIHDGERISSRFPHVQCKTSCVPCDSSLMTLGTLL